MTMSAEKLTLSKAEMRLIAKLLEMAGDNFSNHGCNDMPQEIWDETQFPPEARASLIHEMQTWNGDEEELHPTKLIHIRDDMAMHFYAAKLEKMGQP